MQHDPSVFIKPHFAEYEIDPIVGEWLAELESRPVSAETVKNYRKALLSFTKSLTLHEQPHVLGSITEGNVLAWKTDMRAGRIQPRISGKAHNFQRAAKPAAAATIRAYLIVIKVFTNKWLKRRYTTHDLLELVTLGKQQVELKEAFTPVERDKLLAAVDGSSFELVRDRAFVQLLLATACRFKEIYGLSTDKLDIENRRMWVVLKGGRSVPVDIDGRALRDFRVYLGRRRVVASNGEQAIWITDSGKPLTYWGAYGIFARLEARSGVKCNPHKFRHTVAQFMAASGAPIADVQDVLHHTSDHMARRYIGNARQDVAAGLASKWSLAG